MNILDRFIEGVSPAMAMRRAQARMAIDAMRGFDAASKGRRTAGWHTTKSSSNTENRTALDILRDRSRDLVRNNPYAKNAIDVICTNTVGDGIRLGVTAGEKNVDLTPLKDAWREWADSTSCDYNGKLNFYGMQKLVMRGVAEGGNIIVLKRRVKKKENKYGMQLQLLEGDLLDHNRDNPQIDGEGYILQGIEFDKNGKVVAYWMFDRHPSESFVSRNFVSKRVLAKGVIHVYWIERAGQVAGVPFGTSGMMTLNDFGDYQDAQLIRQKIAACFVAFVKNGNDTLTGKGKTPSLPEKVEPGMIERLGSGEEVTFGSPPAADGHESYSRTTLRGVAAGYGTTYEAMTGDLSNVNFSSGRMGWLEFKRRITDWQKNMMITMFCEEVFKEFLSAADIAGVSVKGSLKTRWTTPRREMIDPLKEVNGLVNEVRGGFKSWQEAIRELGYEPEDVLKQLAEDNANFKKDNLKPFCDPEFDTNRVKVVAGVPPEGS